ncbi:hypothetical protein GOBAR_DD05661 [Gossypium barbadense]|nr:hypothetical protein GOBAR_DD05661 [Gossypium barbadense]
MLSYLGDVEGVEVDGEGDDEGVESDGEDEDIGMEISGHISLGCTVGEDNDSEVVADEYADDFATSDGVDNVADEYVDGVDNVADEYVGDFPTSDRVDNVVDEYAGDFATLDGLDNIDVASSGEEEDGDVTEDLEIEIFDILRRVEHKNCARQVFANWSRRKLRKSYECDFWKILKCTTEKEWEDICSALEKKDKDAYDNLMKKSPKMWTSLLMKAKLDANKKDCVEWQLMWNGENGCELRKGSYQYTVDLSQRIWQISGIPCSHACAVMYHLGLQPDEYLLEYYHIDTYKKAYSFPIQLINGPYDWEKIGIQPMLPPIERKMPGRPKKNRRMAKDELKKLKPGRLSRKGLLMTCTQCGQHGHNKRSCTNSKQQDAQPPKKRGEIFKRSTTLDKSKGKQTFYFGRTTRSMTTTSCQDGSGQTSSTPKS